MDIALMTLVLALMLTLILLLKRVVSSIQARKRLERAIKRRLVGRAYNVYR